MLVVFLIGSNCRAELRDVGLRPVSEYVENIIVRCRLKPEIGKGSGNVDDVLADVHQRHRHAVA